MTIFVHNNNILNDKLLYLLHIKYTSDILF